MYPFLNLEHNIEDLVHNTENRYTEQKTKDTTWKVVRGSTTPDRGQETPLIKGNNTTTSDRDIRTLLARQTSHNDTYPKYSIIILILIFTYFIAFLSPFISKSLKNIETKNYDLISKFFSQTDFTKYL